MYHTWDSWKFYHPLFNPLHLPPQYLAYDTHKIMDGRRYQLSPEEYIVGALSLYMDIIFAYFEMFHCFMTIVYGNRTLTANIFQDLTFDIMP